MGKIKAFTRKWIISELLLAVSAATGTIAVLDATHTDLKPALVSFQQSATNMVTGQPAPTPIPSPNAATSVNSAKQKIAAAPSSSPTVLSASVAPTPAAAAGTSKSKAGSAAALLSDIAILAKITATPQAVWATGGNAAVAVNAAISGGPLASLVVYDIPGRDCGNYSSGGAGSDQMYRDYIDQIAAAIGGRSVRVILEPDALALGCTNTSLFADTATDVGSVTTLKRAGARVYIDAAHANWISANAMTAKLLAANIAGADGFALNVSNFDTTANEMKYGNQLSTLTGGKHYVIDTSRNGNGTTSEWCNPVGRAIGAFPTLTTGNKLVDALIWIKRPAESDGTCNGGPTAGQVFASYAVGLGRAAGW